MKKLIAILILLMIATCAFAQTRVTYPATSFSTSAALEASRVVKATSGSVLWISVYNSKASSQFIQIHNATSLPADAAVPILVLPVAATSFATFEIPVNGLPCSTGIVICNSSTATTKTIGSADCWFSVMYR